MPRRKPLSHKPVRPLAVTQENAAEQLQITPRQIRRMIAAGKLRAIEIGKSGRRVVQSSIDALVTSAT